MLRLFYYCEKKNFVVGFEKMRERRKKQKSLPLIRFFHTLLYEKNNGDIHADQILRLCPIDRTTFVSDTLLFFTNKSNRQKTKELIQKIKAGTLTTIDEIENEIKSFPRNEKLLLCLEVFRFWERIFAAKNDVDELRVC